jgi:hypothetical protein
LFTFCHGSSGRERSQVKQALEGAALFHGHFTLRNDVGNARKSGQFPFLQEIARFAPVPDPFAVGGPTVAESWLVTHTGRIELDFGTGNDNMWNGTLELYLNDRSSVAFDAKRVKAIRYEHGNPRTGPPPRVIRQRADRAFGPLAVMVALGGMHTGDESQSTYGVGDAKATIVETPKPSAAPSFAALRPKIEIPVGVWGEDAHLHSVTFQLIVNAEAGLGRAHEP